VTTGISARSPTKSRARCSLARFPRRRQAYYATIYRDGKDASFNGDGHSLEIESRPVSRHDTLQMKLAPGGGQAIRISTSLGRLGSRSSPKPSPKKPDPEFDVE
jgi:hypothetical protein